MIPAAAGYADRRRRREGLARRPRRARRLVGRRGPLLVRRLRARPRRARACVGRVGRRRPRDERRHRDGVRRPRPARAGEPLARARLRDRRLRDRAARAALGASTSELAHRGADLGRAREGSRARGPSGTASGAAARRPGRRVRRAPRSSARATWAAISAPRPPNWTASCTTTSRCVFATDASIAAVSSGTSVRGSTTSTLTPSASSSCATRSACGTEAPSATTVTSRALARDPRRAEIDRVALLGHRHGVAEEEQLLLEEDDRVVVPDRGREQALGVERDSTASRRRAPGCGRTGPRGSASAARRAARRRPPTIRITSGIVGCPPS